MTVAASERRKFERVSVVGAVRYHGSQGVSCIAINDISCGGIRLHLSAKEKPGTDVEIELTLDQESTPLIIRGRMVWARQNTPYEAGVRFLSLDANQRRKLLELANRTSN